MNDFLRIDLRSLACPQPVLRTKAVLESDHVGDFMVLVDNPAARENVCRFVRSRGCNAETTELPENCFQIFVGRRSDIGDQDVSTCRVSLQADACPQESKVVVYVGTSCMGKGDEELGRKLMRGFLRTWIDVDAVPWRMIFINSGVELTVTDEEAVDALGMLQHKGVEILSCGTCLQHFGYESDLKVGRTTNMYEVVETLRTASKVISPA
jgi:selenium metabolism protein YedF